MQGTRAETRQSRTRDMHDITAKSSSLQVISAYKLIAFIVHRTEQALLLFRYSEDRDTLFSIRISHVDGPSRFCRMSEVNFKLDLTRQPNSAVIHHKSSF